MYSSLRILGLASVLSTFANAHTLFTTSFIDGEGQGDGVCVRMPKDGSTATSPIADITGDDMACGRDGTTGVQFTCSASQGATVSFWWRAWPNYSQTGSIDSSHMGPCAVYVKQVDNATEASGTGSGWFKIWDEGYDATTKQWCTDKVIANDGLMSVDLPSGLPTGDYLIRPEILALHQSVHGDPQFYLGCLQLHVTGDSDGTLDIPSEYEVSIPGYVDMDSEGVVYDVWGEFDSSKDGTDYVTPGPDVYYPTSSSSSSSLSIASSSDSDSEDDYEGIPDGCLIENGNWCGVEVSSYSDEAGCWAASEDCWSQGEVCFDEAHPSGHANCGVWEEKCQEIQDTCDAGDFTGPPNKGVKLTRVDVELPSEASLSAWNSGSGSSNGGSSPSIIDSSSSAASSAVADEPIETEESGSDEETETPTTTEAAESTEIAEEEEGDDDGDDDGDDYDTPDNGIVDEETTTAEAVPTSTDSAETPGPTGSDSGSGGLKVSEDGRCGGTTDQTCAGSEFGSCCSKRGWCGNTRKHCSCGCQGSFGECYDTGANKYHDDEDNDEDGY
ncbi:hypothetical protein MKZ38_002398 [Zalerion maritima]|uniref:lytic cellulose monooxygenase (C4-dehydrogenating) n=1 Tax=Zalerion maritima TaxID=339359 RepID=A0AAD5WQV7_9PEZI|nr:hypothetical protein MKZ38_002398 [Zalerion maritima]